VKARELRDLSLDELQAKERELRGEIFNAKVKKATGQLENVARLQSIRRDIARVETILREKRGASR
jgi:large subunit ribosomal protein L29